MVASSPGLLEKEADESEHWRPLARAAEGGQCQQQGGSQDEVGSQHTTLREVAAMGTRGTWGPVADMVEVDWVGVRGLTRSPEPEGEQWTLLHPWRVTLGCSVSLLPMMTLACVCSDSEGHREGW